LFRERVFDPLSGQWLLSNNLKSPKVDFSTQRNRVRYPLYHRLDISFIKRIQKRGWAILPYLQVINTYYKRNVLFYEWDFKSESGVFVRNTIPMMPIVPTFGVSFEF